MKNAMKELPKCTEEYKQQQIQQVLEADVIYEWECDLVQGLRWVQTSGVVLMSFLFAVLLGDSWGWYLAFGLLGLVMGSASYFLYQSTKRQHVKLTEHGIIVSTVELVPEVFYAATRYAAYVGIVVCLLAVIFVGPLAFVGAGAGALMAFKMTGFNNEPKVEVFPFLKGFRYVVEADFSESYYQDGVSLISLENMDFMPDQIKDENAPDPYEKLRKFHYISFYSNEFQYGEMKQYLDSLIEMVPEDEFFKSRESSNEVTGLDNEKGV
ncbi:hypothetical protein [Photobacterium sp. 1_MG-2023]|uniref:hypothetical protein n=1 Tax=Photobacterium sp. 1_MG-2023 TaxID=3062646 RepID=UPI0026E330AE|nr:hypothetical protein [Photobacterium sp. 1_MG-2023]MDO6708765.1 hypothetical protein [Photobacterium sp. 1_MG-2023]